MATRQKKRFWHYFQTVAGRNVVTAAACATSIGLFCVNFVPQTFCLDYYREIVQCYESGIERPIPKEVKRRLEEAFEKLDVYEYDRKIIKPFTVYGFDLFTAGSTKHRTGALLGIPVNYGYSSIDDINRNEIRFRDRKIDWKSESGQHLEKALVLTEDEQLFGLCKSILQLQTHRPLLNSIFPSVCFAAVYTMGHYINLRANMFARPLSLRLIIYSILGLFGTGSWFFMKDFNQVGYDVDIDKKLSDMGAPFVEAGISFYDKQLQKNLALRALLGDDTYTAKGNENYLLRHKSLPLTLRKSFFEEKWRELKQKSGQEVDATELAQ